MRDDGIDMGNDFRLFLAKTVMNRMSKQNIDNLADEYHCNPIHLVFVLANFPVHISVSGRWKDTIPELYTIPELFEMSSKQIFVGVDWLKGNLDIPALTDFVVMRLKGEISV